MARIKNKLRQSASEIFQIGDAKHIRCRKCSLILNFFCNSQQYCIFIFINKTQMDPNDQRMWLANILILFGQKEAPEMANSFRNVRCTIQSLHLFILEWQTLLQMHFSDRPAGGGDAVPIAWGRGSKMVCLKSPSIEWHIQTIHSSFECEWAVYIRPIKIESGVWPKGRWALILMNWSYGINA